MAKINLLRKSTSFDPKEASYRISLEVYSTENISKNVFIKQRLKNFVKNNFDDVFVAIATPAQLEDFDVDSPAADTSFYRTSKIDLISRNAAYLEEVFESVLSELQKLVDDHEALNALSADGLYIITANDVEFNTMPAHMHYRIPLVARPCGDNEVFTVSTIDYQRVSNENTALTGWLNYAGPDYKFKYNIDADTTLAPLWPPDTDKIGYWHLEVNGVTKEAPHILISADGIFWKENTLGDAPFPEDYVSPLNTGAELILVLDLLA